MCSNKEGDFSTLNEISGRVHVPCSVVYWPSSRPNMPFQSDAPEGCDTFRWQLWEEIASAGLADDMGQGKIPWYTHRLMHRKRVTCELHDSYFRLMTIKHAIPKIEWAIELLYNSVKTGSQWVGDQRSQRQVVVEKTTTRQNGPSGPSVSWRSDELESRCSRESHQPAEGALGIPDGVWRPDQLVIRYSRESQYSGPRASDWASGERERHNADGHKSGGQYIAVLFGLQLPLTRKPYNKVRSKFF